MIIFELSEFIAAMVALLLGIASLFLIPHWVPAKMMEKSTDFGGHIRAAGVVLILVAMILLYEIAKQLFGVLKAC